MAHPIPEGTIRTRRRNPHLLPNRGHQTKPPVPEHNKDEHRSAQEPIPNSYLDTPNGHNGKEHTPTVRLQPTSSPKERPKSSGQSGTAPIRRRCRLAPRRIHTQDCCARCHTHPGPRTRPHRAKRIVPTANDRAVRRGYAPTHQNRRDWEHLECHWSSNCRC